MPFTYDGAAGVFTHLGSLVARINSYRAVGLTTLPNDLTTLLTVFGLTWLPEEGVAAYYEGLRDSVTGWRQGLGGLGDRRLTDLVTVLAQLGLQPGDGLDAVLPAIVRRMTLDGRTVKASTCAVGPVTYQAGNRGNGRGWVTPVLDGYNAPVQGGLADIHYEGWASQMMVPAETMELECVADSVQDGLSETGELWRWSGGPAYGDLDVRAEGSGEGPGLQTAEQGNNLLANGSLDTWSAGQPSGWTRTLGTADQVKQDTVVAIRGGSSVRFSGNAGVLQLRQAVPPALLQGRRRYFVGAAVRWLGASPGAMLRVFLSGTGVSPGESLQVDGAAGTAAWSPMGYFVTMPAPIPPDWALYVEVQGLPSGAVAWVDALSLTPVTYHGGVAAAITAGSSRWQKGDRISFTTSNDQAGKFQDYFRRHHRTQLPSVLSGVAQGYFLGLPFTLMTTTTAEGISDGLVV